MSRLADASDDRLPASLLERAARLRTATLHEAADQRTALPRGIRALVPGTRLVGRALTVHSTGGDNLWLHRGLERARAGDVLVVSTSGDYDYGYWGELMTVAARARALAGLVIDGSVRDADSIESLGFPVFCRGLCVRGTRKDPRAPGAIDEPLLLGNALIVGGDLVAADRDGVVSIPRRHAARVVEAAERRTENEMMIRRRLEAGESTLSVYGWDRPCTIPASHGDEAGE